MLLLIEAEKNLRGIQHKVKSCTKMALANKTKMAALYFLTGWMRQKQGYKNHTLGSLLYNSPMKLLLSING